VTSHDPAWLRRVIVPALHDVEAVVGPNEVGVYFVGDGPVPPELSRLRECAAWAYVRGGHSASGFDLDFWGSLQTSEAVARAAGVLQELVMERAAASSAFPPCPDHAEPLWPEVVRGRAVWRCTRGGATEVLIGTWPEA
jgi:hypothetical protein